MTDKKDGNNLNEKQYRAIPLILEGKTDTEVAEAVGVSRSTVNIWKNQDPNFIAELNRERTAIRETIKKKHTDTVLKAYKVLNKALDSELNKEDPDPKIALEIIKIYKEPEIKLKTDPDKVKKDLAFEDMLAF